MFSHVHVVIVIVSAVRHDSGFFQIDVLVVLCTALTLEYSLRGRYAILGIGLV